MEEMKLWNALYSATVISRSETMKFLIIFFFVFMNIVNISAEFHTQ
jgi:hypothetical protein